MLTALQRKNIESFFVDILIILFGFFISEIQISSEVFLFLVVISSLILIISKKPPKGYFLIILYVLSILFLFFGLILIIQDLFTSFSIESINFNYNIESWIILAFSFIVLILFFISFRNQNKVYRFTLTYLIPILFTLLVFSVTYIANTYSSGIGVVILLYLPLRFLMAFKEPIKWYQFILLIAALVITLNSFVTSETDSPISVVKNELTDIYAKYSVSEFEDYGTDKIIKVELTKRSYATMHEEGDYYFAVTNNDSLWVLDFDKTIEYYKEVGRYQSDSSKIHYLIFSMSE